MPSSINPFHGIDPAIVGHESGSGSISTSPNITVKDTDPSFIAGNEEDHIIGETDKNDVSGITNNNKNENNNNGNNGLIDVNDTKDNDNSGTDNQESLVDSVLDSPNYTSLDDTVNNGNFNDFYKKQETSSITRQRMKQEGVSSKIEHSHNATLPDSSDALLPLQHLAQASLRDRSDEIPLSNQIERNNQVNNLLFLHDTNQDVSNQSHQTQKSQRTQQFQQGDPQNQPQIQAPEQLNQYQTHQQNQQNQHRQHPYQTQDQLGYQNSQQQQHSQQQLHQQHQLHNQQHRHQHQYQHQQQQQEQQQIQPQILQSAQQQHRPHSVEDVAAVAAEYMQYEPGSNHFNNESHQIDYTAHPRSQIMADNTNITDRHDHIQSHGNSISSNILRSNDNSVLIQSSKMMGSRSDSNPGERRLRQLWSEQETQCLVDGCKVHGVGNWKKILIDPRYVFNNRTAVDLKDRFRTIFPEDYGRLYPNARTHKSSRANLMLEPNQLIKVDRKERRAFSSDEDERLLKGFIKHGPSWSKIQRDTTLELNNRRSTDLRDRFRNAFPERYAAAGFKGRRSHTSSKKKNSIVTNNIMPSKFAEDPIQLTPNELKQYTQEIMPSLDSTAAEVFGPPDQYNSRQRESVQTNQHQYQQQQFQQRHNQSRQQQELLHRPPQQQHQQQPKQYSELHQSLRSHFNNQEQEQLAQNQGPSQQPLNQPRQAPQLLSDRKLTYHKTNSQQKYPAAPIGSQAFGLPNNFHNNNNNGMNPDIAEEQDMNTRQDPSHVQTARYVQRLQDHSDQQQLQLQQQKLYYQQQQQQQQTKTKLQTQTQQQQQQSVNTAAYYPHIYPPGAQS